MKKYLLIILFVFITIIGYLSCPGISRAQVATPSALTNGLPPDGTWLSDNEVTFAGKNAARSKDLFNWVLINYQWSTKDNTLISFWAKIRNVVFVFLIILVMVSAFLMIITGGQSITAMQFIRKFLIVIILITFSYAFIRIFYQIIDIFQSFFIKNPDGQIISSKDLLNISFNYDTFEGYRKYGADYNEAAFISLLLTKITAATYFVMAGVLIVRKVILWFFITVSPIYPILLLYFPVRNTAKIWIGEFFRWLLYAPLFAIFLSGLVVLWRDNLSVLPFHFTQSGQSPLIVYPTAINILLGGPGQTLAIDNNINYTDTFAEYIVALIMLWVVIFLPFLLLRIFLDYLSTVSLNNNPAWKYIVNNANKIVPSNDFFINKKSTPPPTTPPPAYRPTGSARTLPFPAGQAKQIPIVRPVGEARTTMRNTLSQPTQTYNTQNISNIKQMPIYKSAVTSAATSQLVNFSIPTMRDVAKFETSRLSSQISSHQETSKVHETLQKISNPQSIANPVERQQFNTIREKLTLASQQGEPLATSILTAANNTSRVNTNSVTNNSYVSQTTLSQESQQNISQVTQHATTQVQQVLQKIANPQSIANVSEREQVTELKGRLTQQAQQGNSYATTILNTISNFSQNSSPHTQQSNTQIQQIVEKLAHPQNIKDSKDRQQINDVKQTLSQEKAKGNPIAASILSSVENVEKAQTNTTLLPMTNQVQTVNLEDYEEVKKTWAENYQKAEIPKTLDNPDRTRQQWIQDDISKTTHAIDMLTSQDQKNVQDGMKEVSTLLPFLLLGGFSQTEVVAYLQAKKHAAEEVLTITKEKDSEDDTLLDSKTQTIHTQQTMHVENTTVPATTNITNEQYEESPLSQITNSTNSTVNNVSQPVFKSPSSTQAQQIVNFSIPTIRDVATYEAATMTATHPVHTQVEQMHDMMQKLSNPQAISDEKERQTYIVMKQQLMLAKEGGDPLAASILSTTQNISQIEQTNTVTQDIFHETLNKLANPEKITNTQEKEQYLSLKEKLVEEKQKGNPLAVSLINSIENSSHSTQQDLTNETNLYQTTLQEKQKGNKLAIHMIDVIDLTIKEQQKQGPQVDLPSVNQVQTVNLEDYEEVRKTWQENYKNIDVPKTFDNPNRTRQEWIREDVAKTANAIALLTSEEPQKKKDGMQFVAELLPFLLLGGFSEAEVIAYLQAKEHAGEDVLKDVQSKETEDETTVEAHVEEKEAENSREMQTEDK